MQKDTVFMKSGEGEIREVEATPEVLTPLMAAGWHQHHPEKSPVAPAEEGK
jgi:hypothetical protein